MNRVIPADFRWRPVRLLRFDELAFVVPIVVPILFQGIMRGIIFEGGLPGYRDRDVINGRATKRRERNQRLDVARLGDQAIWKSAREMTWKSFLERKILQPCGIVESAIERHTANQERGTICAITHAQRGK